MFLFAQRLRISLSESSKPHPIFFLFHFITILRFVTQNAPITCTCDITSFFFYLCKLDFINYTLVIYLMYHVVQFKIFSPKLKFSMKHMRCSDKHDKLYFLDVRKTYEGLQECMFNILVYNLWFCWTINKITEKNINNV